MAKRATVHVYCNLLDAHESFMKKKPVLEADLDPPGTRHTRPGAKAAEAALANAGSLLSRRRRGGTSSAKPAAGPTRPGATAAARAVEGTKPARKRRK
jgi:hypothetical protein